jgi:hypothetical protein
MFVLEMRKGDKEINKNQTIHRFAPQPVKTKKIIYIHRNSRYTLGYVLLSKKGRSDVCGIGPHCLCRKYDYFSETISNNRFRVWASNEPRKVCFAVIQ